MELTIGIVVVLLFLIVAVGVGVKCYIKKKKENKDGVTKSKETEMKITEKPTSRCMPMHSIRNGDITLPSQDEFEQLISYDGGISQRFTTSQGERFNNKKYGFNRVPENLPFDHNRLRLKNRIKNFDYVNANHISPPSDDRAYDELIYTTHLPFKSIQFSIGQNPLPQTMNHHFRLIHESRFDVIVSLMGKASETLFKSGRTYHYKDLVLQVLSRTQMEDHLFRTEFSLFNESVVGFQYKHHATYYEFVNWPKDEIAYIEDADELVSSLCAIRNEISSNQSSTKCFVHDCRGGVAGSALFLIMYELMELIDESFTEDNNLKKGAPDIDVFPIVNRLRKDRAKMIEDFSTYKLLFYCIGNYGKNRLAYHEAVSNSMGRKSNPGDENDSTRVNGATNEILYQNNPTENTFSSDEIEYVLHESSDEDKYSIFDEYAA